MRTKNRSLLFEDDSGNTNAINAEVLASLLENLKGDIRLVVLNACHTRLVVEAFKEKIDFTIGMNDAVRRPVCNSFLWRFL